MTGTLPEHAHMCTTHHAHFAKCLSELRSTGKSKSCREKRNERFLSFEVGVWVWRWGMRLPLPVLCLFIWIQPTRFL